MAPSLAHVRALYRHVRARYASLQHQLTVDERRAFRGRIGQLRTLIQTTQDERWQRHIGRPLSLAATGYFTGHTHRRAAILLAMSRARHYTPILTEAIHGSKHRR